MEEPNKNRPYYKECEGVLVCGVLSSDAVRSAINYQHKPGDLFVVTYPKCGTTWMQHIVMLILRKGAPLDNPLDFHLNSPSLEMCGDDAFEHMTGPGAIKTHLPLHMMKLNPDAKYIYVARNPKDCCVSYYHHTRNIPIYNFQDGTFDEFFDLFVKGKVDYGNYFDHLLPWYEKRNERNVHFLTFEALKKNTKSGVLTIAKFIGEEYERSLLEDSRILDNVLWYSSFEYMKNNSNSRFGNFMRMISENAKRGTGISTGLKAFIENVHKFKISLSMGGDFFRKGVVDDWKNHFTDEQEKRFEELIREKTGHCDVMSLWKQN